MEPSQLDRKEVTTLLDGILEMELASVVRYTHYSFMVFGHSRIPIVSWLRGEASSSMQHALSAGELITHLGEHPSLSIGPLLETHKHDIDDILREALANERETLQLYKQLLSLVEGRSVMIEEYAREMVRNEEMHLGEVDKMLRQPGDIEAYRGRSNPA